MPPLLPRVSPLATIRGARRRPQGQGPLPPADISNICTIMHDKETRECPKQPPPCALPWPGLALWAALFSAFCRTMPT